MPVCDLRHLNDVNSIRQIEEIRNIALLILPNDASEEVMSAIAGIPKSSIASTIPLSKNDNIRVINGVFEASDSDFAGEANTVIVVNGVVLIKDISRETKGDIIANGMVILQESLRGACALNFPMVNGIRTYMDFDAYKVYPDEIEIDSDFISYLAPKTMIKAGHQISVKNDVTAEILKEKDLKLIAGDCINCYENVASYVKANSFVGDKINVLAADNNG
jgi:hypothetical protein